VHGIGLTGMTLDQRTSLAAGYTDASAQQIGVRDAVRRDALIMARSYNRRCDIYATHEDGRLELVDGVDP
jgi:hypothetical protein